MAMTDGGAYLPCLNTSCKSHGASHPNCRCYPGLAEGGEVDPSFCSKDRAHGSDCQYFVDGGVIEPDSPIQDPPTTEAVQPAPPDSASAEEIVPDSPIQDPEEITPDSPIQDPPTEAAIADPTGKYAGTTQKILTGIESAGRALTGGLTDVAAKGMRSAATAVGVPDKYLDLVAPSAEDMAGRAKAHDIIDQHTHDITMLAALLTGEGIPGLITKGSKALIPEATSVLGKIGGQALRNGVESMALTGGDEISKAMLDQGDPNAPVSAAIAHIGAAGLLGTAAGGFFGTIGRGAEALGRSKIANGANEFLAGIGAANAASKVKAVAAEMADSLGKLGEEGSAWFKRGVDFHERGMKRIVKELSDAPAELVGAKIGSKIGDKIGVEGGGLAGGVIARKVLGPVLEKLIGVPVSSTINKYAIPAILKVLSGGTIGDEADLIKAYNYSSGISKGVQKMTNAVEDLFKVGTVEAAPVVGDAAREKLRKYIAEGKQNEEIEAERVQQDPPAYAEGGEVSPISHGESKPITQGTEYLAKHYPDQNIMLQAARGRVNGYLNSIRPLPHQSKLPYDTSVQDSAKEKSYNRALDIANNPLSVMTHVKNGTVTPEHMMHLTSLYPEVHQHLVKALTERITKGQLKGEKMPYHVRQSASLFLGTPLDSTMSPESIRLIQSTFMPKNQQPPADKGAAPLEKGAQGAQTSSQALAARQQRSR